MSNRLDQLLLEELRLLMEDDFTVLLETFLGESERQFQTLRLAWQGGDMEALRRGAHSLKGSCSNIGAQTLAALCAELERCAKRSHEGIVDMLSQIEAEVSAVQDEVRLLCAAEGGTG